MAETISGKQKGHLNKANMLLLLSALDPKRKDIIVTEKSRRYSNEPKEWHVKNTKGQEIFSLRTESFKYEDGRYDIYCRLLTLQVNGITISIDTECYGSEWDTMVFLDKELQEALQNKLCAQEEEKQLQKELKHMSAQDVMMKKYLENVLQK